MIYFLDPDENIRQFVLYALNGRGMDAIGFTSANQFWSAMEQRMPELLLMEVVLPEEDGLSILKHLRTSPATHTLPVILLSQKSTEFDKVLGLDTGADDYIAKPFSMMELISRIKALLRRSRYSQTPEEYAFGPVQVNIKKHTVTVSGKPVVLTLKEFELLVMLLENQGTVLSRDQLQNKIWGYEFDGGSRTVDVHIRTLRQKLGQGGDIIETVRGVGYKIGDQPPQISPSSAHT